MLSSHTKNTFVRLINAWLPKRYAAKPMPMQQSSSNSIQV